MLPRALALRAPTTANTHAVDAPGQGRDRWGEVYCDTLLRAKHLGVIAALCGAWRYREDREDRAGYLTVGELAHQLQHHRWRGGHDLAWVYEALVEVEQLELRAEVDVGEDGEASQAHAIPGGPLFTIEHRLDGRWLSLADYAQALGDETAAGRCGREDTLRVVPSAWLCEQISEHRPVFLDFGVWRSLRPQEQRLYAWLQGHNATNGQIYLDLAPPDRYSLGLGEGRLDRCAKTVRDALANIGRHDHRYAPTGDQVAFQEGKHRASKGPMRYPAFIVHVNVGRSSAPTALAREMKSHARRPAPRLHASPDRTTGSDQPDEQPR